MTKFAMEMILEYPKVFEENRDMGGDQNNAAKKAAKHDGQYVVNAYFTSEEQIQELLEGGMDPMPMGNKRVKEGNDFGIGKYVKLTRMHDHKMTFTDKKGNPTEVDFLSVKNKFKSFWKVAWTQCQWVINVSKRATTSVLVSTSN